MDKIKKAWEEYHGDPVDHGTGEPYYPKAPPAFMRGYVDGYEEGKRESTNLLESLLKCFIRKEDGLEWQYMEGVTTDEILPEEVNSRLLDIKNKENKRQ